MDPMPPSWLDLFDYRQRVTAFYRDRAQALARGVDPETVWRGWCASRDALFARHPQSALSVEDRVAFTGLNYFSYDLSLRVQAILTPEPPRNEELPASHPHPGVYTRAGQLRFTLVGSEVALTVYWIDVYGGGLILPFRDATGPAETYGAGRYLFDTVKGSDFQRLDSGAGLDGPPDGYGGGRVMLDFNYAYNPSCAYDPKWACPLAPRDNWLTVPIRAGELNYHA
ncbi:MAG TPA: DUF1684 domain-containing protein [Ktedonobacterales bacterium]